MELLRYKTTNPKGAHVMSYLSINEAIHCRNHEPWRRNVKSMTVAFFAFRIDPA